MKLKTTVLLEKKTATGVHVPDEFVSQLGSGRKPAVSVTINGYTYRTSIGSMGGRFMLPISSEVRKNAGIEAGDEIELDIKIDDQPREVIVPADLSEALEASPLAKKLFETLSYSRKNQIVLLIDQAKSPETRQKRISASVISLSEGKTG